MFAATQGQAGGPNRFMHNREPAPVDNQPVIRMNRDTLYSFAGVDLSAGARLTVPDGGERYVSVMVVNNDHHINRILHDAGEYELTEQEFGSRHVAVVARVLVDPGDPDDVAAVAALQDRFGLEAGAADPFVPGSWDTTSLDTTRNHLLGLAAGMTSFVHSFGRREDVDPVHHLISTAAGWGGLPDVEATYVGVSPGLPVGRYELTVGEVPVDGFWSISVYNADGYFEPNELGPLRRQRHHRGPKRRRLRDGAVRWLRARCRELPAHHRGLELPRAPLPPAGRGAGRHLALPVPDRPRRLTLATLDSFQKTGETSDVPPTPDVEQLLRGASLRVTRPRVAVLGAVQEQPHASTDTIIEVVRRDLGEVSHQAVYDVLRALTTAGLLRRIQPSGSVARYESRVGDNHHHVVCRACGTIADVDCAVDETPCLTASDDHGFVIDEAEVVYWGTCPQCAARTGP
jgi:Fe2+ or Zn2+ uptake regulation protein